MPTSLRRRVAAPLLALLLAAPAACGGDPTGPRVGDILVQPAPLVLNQREVHRLQVTVTDASGALLAGVAVTFASTDERIVTVSSIGEVTSVGPAGAATIRVTAAGVTKPVPVTVRGIATAVRVTPNPGTLPQLGTLQLQPKVIDAVGDEMAGHTFTFQSFTPELLRVDAAGLVTAVGPHGAGTIVVRSGVLVASVPLTVTQVAAGMRVLPQQVVLGTNRSVRLVPSLVDAIGADMPPGGVAFTFQAEVPALVTVDPDGTVRSGAAVGSTTVRVLGGGHAVVVPVRVTEEAPRPEGVVAGRIAVPGAWGVAYGADGAAYAISTFEGVFRLDRHAQTATNVTTATRGLDLVISGDGARAYVANQEGARVDLVDLATGAVLRSSGTFDSGVLTDLLSLDGGTLWVGSGLTITALDATTLATIATIPTDPIVHLARHPTQPLLYGSSNRGTIVEIDLATRTLRRTFTLEGWLQAIAVSPDGATLYAANEYGAMQLIDLASGAVAGTIGGSGVQSLAGSYGMAMSRDGLRLYVGLTDGRLAVVDPNARGVTRWVPLGGGARRITLSPAGDELLVALETGSVVVVR